MLQALLPGFIVRWHLAKNRTAALNGRYRGIAEIVTTFGTRGSQVQILPLRPIKSMTYGAGHGNLFVRATD